MNVYAPVLSSNASPEIDAERRNALRALLRNPLLPAAGETAKDYNVVRKHAVWLKQWLAKYPAWELQIDNEVARLRKAPGDISDDTKPAIDASSGTPFSRRRYALLCLALAAVEKSEQQTTLGKIAESIMEFIAADRALQGAGLVFDISNHDQRRDLVHAVRLLLDIGILRRIHGDESQFLNRTGASDALYDINRAILALILNISHSPSAIEAAAAKTGVPVRRSVAERAAEVMTDPQVSAEPDSNASSRARIVRMLLDDPILYFDDLTEDERVYFDRHRGFLLRQIRDVAGLIPEVRFEGVAMVDDAGELTDIRLPEEGTDGHIALLLAEWLAGTARRRPGDAIPMAAIEQQVATFIRTHGSRWRKAVREPGAEARVAQDALIRLRALRLVRQTDDGVIPLAASGRYASGRSLTDIENQE